MPPFEDEELGLHEDFEDETYPPELNEDEYDYPGYCDEPVTFDELVELEEFEQADEYFTHGVYGEDEPW